MDFVSDQLSNGRRFRVLNLIDEYSREVIDQLVSFSISGQQVARFLEPDDQHKAWIYPVRETDTECICGKLKR
jgi:hypothetical protein